MFQNKQLGNFNLQTEIITTGMMVQFCVSKSQTFNDTSHITVQLACSNTYVVCPPHQLIIRRMFINRFLLVTQSKYHAIYIHK